MPIKKKKNIKKQSVFKPSKKQFYEVIYTSHDNTFISSTQPNTKIKHSKQNKNENKSKKRKKWSKELKQKAIEYTKSMGLSEATRFLQQMDEYKELRTSTLYYWVKSDEKDEVII